MVMHVSLSRPRPFPQVIPLLLLAETLRVRASYKCFSEFFEYEIREGCQSCLS